MNPRFFIDRPIFAWVVALCILLGGVLTLRALPIEQYPTVAPPSLTISATYPGADAATLEQNVTQVIEQELNGVEDLLYMASTSNSNGSASITVTFESGTDIDKAQMDVQNQLTLVEQRLPEEVRRQGIPVRQANRSEEHTSELQSLMRNSYAVFCLKKKTTTQQDNEHDTHDKTSDGCYDLTEQSDTHDHVNPLQYLH